MRFDFFLLLVALFFNANSLYSQSNLSIQNMAEFSQNHGRISNSVPLFTLDFGSTSIPIVLNYSSNGLRYNDKINKVGVGWSINFDYAFRQNLRGRNDFTSIMPNLDSISNLLNSYSSINSSSAKLQRDLLLKRFAINNYSENMGSDGNYPTDNTPEVEWDSEYDIFTFETLLNGGKFIVLDRNNFIPNDFSIQTKRIQFFDTQQLRQKILRLSDSEQIVADDNGNNFYFSKITSGGSECMLTQAISPEKDSVLMSYTYFPNTYLYNDSRILTFVEGCENCIGGYPYNTSYHHKEPVQQVNYEALLSKIITNTLLVNISYTKIANQYIYDEIELRTKSTASVLLKKIKFEYDSVLSYVFLKNVKISAGDNDGDIRKYEFEYHSIGTAANFDTDMFGYVISTPSYIQSPIINTDLKIYNKSAFSSSFDYHYISAIDNSIPVHYKISEIDDKGMLKKVTYPNGSFSTYRYKQNRFIPSVNNSSVHYFSAGVNLTEKIDYDGMGNYKKVLFFYGDVPIYYDYDSIQVGNGWMANSFILNWDELDKKYIKQKAKIIAVPNSSFTGYSWALFNSYEINSLSHISDEQAGVNKNAIYYDKIREVHLMGDRPVRMIEYLFDRDGVDQPSQELTQMNNNLIVSGRGPIARTYFPQTIYYTFTSKQPKLFQNNIFEYHQNTWRIRKKETNNYGVDSNIGLGYVSSIRALKVRDFAKIINSNSSLSFDNIYTNTGVDSFFDFNFYHMRFDLPVLLGKDIVDYTYNN